MALLRSCTTLLCAVLLLLFPINLNAQQILPSNDTADVPAYDSSPRFWVNGTDFDHFRVVPLGWYARISQSHFLSIEIEAWLVHVNASHLSGPRGNGILYLSCDPEDYSGQYGPNDVLQMAANDNPGFTIILYSTRADHCQASNLRSLASANGIFTTLNATLAATVTSQISSSSDGVPAAIVPDTLAYTQPNNSGGYSSNDRGPGPTTAVAMIVLYTITGLITALFVVIIITGALRAHRHPERYGPRNMPGRPRRSRAKGIARAMLDTIPIVKFGEKEDEANKEAGDVELATAASKATNTNAGQTKEVTNVATEEQSAASNADGSDETGHLGCSICTEDFNKGEEVRVLPCNHKFHPECVDPWLLNVSGTCPLCRIDLRPKEEQEAGEGGDSTSRNASVAEGATAPPLGERRGSNAGRRDTVAFAGLMSVASGTREDRIAALRRFRQQRRSRTGQSDTAEQPDDERRGVSARLRERFRVRTRRQGEDNIEEVRP